MQAAFYMQSSFNTDTAIKYDVRAPRYTSYPTAPHFSNMSPEVWNRQLKEEEAEHQRPLSLYFHIPFCERLCYFCGCNMMVTRNREKIKHYLSLLEQEMQLMAQQIDISREVIQIHWGGGTPSYLLPEEIRWLGHRIWELFNVSWQAEIGVEINPHQLSFEHMQAFREVGFNRISIGVQDFDDHIQQTVNRWQTAEEVEQAVSWSRALGFDSVNMDLMYGLPLQNRDKFRNTLQKVLTFRPDRLAVFNFAFVPEFKPHQKVLLKEQFPDKYEKLHMFADAVDQLTSNGYTYIGMDHFALKGDELSLARENGTIQRNFQGYSTLAGADLLAFGISSISSLSNSYAQNVRSIEEYEEALQRGQLPVFRGLILGADDILRRQVIMDIMCKLKLDVPAIAEHWNIDFENYFEEALEALKPLEADGLLQWQGDVMEVTEQGRFFLRNIAMVFDNYMQGEQVLHSKAV